MTASFVLGRSIAIVGAAMALASGATPASAQIQQLPETSRSEAQSNAINNSLAVQGRNRGIAQQNQFEVNSLRNESAIRSAPAPIVAAPPIAGPAGVRR